MKKTLLMLAFVAATSMVALAHGDEKKGKDGKKDACCSKEGAKKELAGAKSCCSKDGAKTTKVEKAGKAEKVADKTEAPKN